MGDSTDLESALVITELKEWLDSSLCGCGIDKSVKVISEEKKQEDKSQDGVESPSQADSSILEKMAADGRIFQWLIHSFKPETISCPSNADTGENEFSNLQLAFKIAQDEFGVQNLFSADDFTEKKSTDGKLDTLLLLTYLAQLKYALRNMEPVCTTLRPQINFNWPFGAEKDPIFLRSIAESPKCHNCHETVLILDRLLLSSSDNVNSANVVRHRRCFRCERCQKLLRIGLYRPTKSGVGYECLEHEKNDLIERAAAASDQKSKTSEKDQEKVEKDESKIYPDLSKPEQQGTLYPRLASPEEKTHDLSADSGVATSSPDLTMKQSPNENHLSPPPVPSRSRSSDRGQPVPVPRKSLQGKDGSDIATASSAGNSIENISAVSNAISPIGKQAARPARPVIPPKPKASPTTVTLRQHYPEELNPFGDPEPKIQPTVRHSIAVASDTEKVKTDQRLSMAVGASIKPSSKTTTKAEEKSAKEETNYEKTLNPFGSDSESDDDGKEQENDDASSLSSTNPFNDSEDESEGKNTPFEDDSKTDGKKLPPPRPPPPAKTSPVPSASTPKPTTKKRPAPPPPPPPPSSSQPVVSGGPPPRPVSPKKQHRKKRPAPPRPLPLKRQIRTESALLPEQVTAAFDENEKNLLEVEAAGGSFEKDLRQNSNEKGLAIFSADACRDWIDFVHRKFELVRKETELVYICRERQLDELHAELEYQLRCIIEKPESEKTSDDMDREASLLQRMLDVIEEKSKLVDNQDEMQAQTGASLFPRRSIQLDDSSHSGNASKSSTLDRSKGTEEKQAKKKKKIKLRLKKLKQKIANSTLLHHSS